MPPPPSQAGRFKPRKPGKKIRVGVTGVGAQPDAVGSSSAAAVPAAAAAASTSSATATTQGSGGGRGSPKRGGRGRGGRGGRGGRTPPQQGQVFFTAQQAPSTTAKRRGGATSSRSSTAQQQQQEQQSKTGSSSATTIAAAKRAAAASVQDEEVVGTVDGGGVGASAAAAAASAKKKTPDTVKSAALPSEIMSSALAVNSSKASRVTSAGGESTSFFYLSDSSDEEEATAVARSRVRQSGASKLQPLVLPFPVPVAPTGIGGKRANDSMDIDATTTTTTPDESAAPAVANKPKTTPPASPFCDVDNLADLQAEHDSWFLVQMPTRLPPLRKSLTQDATMEDDQSTQQQQQPSELADVAIPPVQAHAFDNVLSHLTVPGKVGKIRVYKSGKTVLVLESSSSHERQRRPVVEMNVTEGFTCSFRQQAVAIDEVSKDFTPLGKVLKTIVVTPGGLDQSLSS